MPCYLLLTHTTVNAGDVCSRKGEDNTGVIHMYKIETHLHTPLISHCAELSPEELVLGYKEAGYAAITVTDHYKAFCFSYAGIN